MMKKRILLGSVLILIVLSACNKGSKQSSEESTDESLVEITAEQFNRANMLLGGITKETFRDEVVAKGILQAPSDATAKVSAPVSGTVKSPKFNIEVQFLLSLDDFRSAAPFPTKEGRPHARRG